MELYMDMGQHAKHGRTLNHAQDQTGDLRAVKQQRHCAGLGQLYIYNKHIQLKASCGFLETSLLQVLYQMLKWFIHNDLIITLISL